MNQFTLNELNLSNNMRMLWEQHIYWTRLLIISILDNLNDLQETQKRLLRNPVDIGMLYGKFYGPAIQKSITDLLTEHLTIGADLIVASKNNDSNEINRLNSLWYNNADRMAKAFASINPYYLESDIRDMLYLHLDLTKNEVALRLQGKYAEDVANFDKLEIEALKMSDYFTAGIIRQFQNMFTRYVY